MDRKTNINRHNQRKTHYFKLFASCAIGGLVGYSVLFSILSLNPSMLSFEWGVINNEGLVWSAISYAVILLGLKFFFDFGLWLSSSSQNQISTTPTAAPIQNQFSNVLKRLEEQETEKLWKGFRPFIVFNKVFESPDQNICSFYLKPYDSQWLPPFRPGQYLTFRLDHIPRQSKALVRCYSLSDRVNEEYYRVSIKRVPAPKDRPDLKPGLSSNYFHDGIKIGDILDVKAPSGHFNLQRNSQAGVVLIAGGVGFTPMISMLNTLLSEKSKREVWFFYAITNSEQHAMKEYLEEIGKNHNHVHLVVCYSRPQECDEKWKDFQHQGRLSLDVLKHYLPSSNFEYYLCGPGALMTSLTEGLTVWGVPTTDVHYEAFGPASVTKKKKKSVLTHALSIQFDQSSEKHSWTGDDDSLLDFALDKGLDMPFGCKMGNCGSCETDLLNGKVTYPAGKPGYDVESGKCLPCVCIPESDITLDA